MARRTFRYRLYPNRRQPEIQATLNASALLQLKNNPALRTSDLQYGLALKADGQVFTRAQ